jgi:hypothetical protein
MKNSLTIFGFGLKWKNWIDNPNPKSNFNFGLKSGLSNQAIQSSNKYPAYIYSLK